MSNLKNVWMWIAAALLCTTIASAYLALNYQSQLQKQDELYQQLLSDVNQLQGSLDVLTIMVDIKIDYGNDTIIWYNETRVPLNIDLLSATHMITEVEYSTSEFGIFVTGINKVGGDADKFWLWYNFEENTYEWQYGLVASDAWILHDGDIVSWVYSGF